jgi:SAM-dependent methyltransferase
MTATATSLRPKSEFDQNKAQAFAGRMLSALNDAALVLMTSIGHRTGLLGHLANLSPCTVEQLASAAGLSARYVREWLAVMTTSGIADYRPQTRTYMLPREHAAFLTYGGPVNIAVNAQFLGVTAGVEDKIVECFQTGGGVHYHHYGRFHEVMAEASHQSVVSKLMEHVLPLIPEARTNLERGIDVVDVGCGAGKALLRLAKEFPNSRFLGLDLCAEAFAESAADAQSSGLGNLKFETRDMSADRDFGPFDIVMAFDAVHDQKDPQGLLDSIRRALRDDGVFLMVDIGGSSHLEKNIEHPLGSFLYMMSSMHCTPVSLGQGGAGLGAMWGVEKATDMLRRAGFSSIELTRLPHDIVNAYFVARH